MDKTVVKALKALELLCVSGAARGVSEFARELKLPKSNIHRLLATLEAQGFVRQLPDKTYALTFKIWELGVAAMSRVDVKAVAPKHMERLVKATNESALLALLDGFDVVYIDKVESQQAIQATTKIGSRIPAHCVGTGKAMLAFQPPEFIGELLRSARAYTKHTVHQKSALLEQLKQARARGYAINRGEFREGVSGVGAAILDRDGRAVAGVGIWGPEARISPRLEKLAKHVVQCANEISRELGFVKPRLSQLAS